MYNSKISERSDILFIVFKIKIERILKAVKPNEEYNHTEIMYSVGKI